MKQMTQKRHLIHFLDCLWMHMKHTFHLKENKISNRNKQKYIKYKNKLNHIIKIAKNSTTKNN